MDYIMSEENEIYLEGDTPIPGQSFVCISFLSPEEVVKSKELYMFHRFMTQRCGQWANAIDKITKNAGDVLKNKINKELKENLRLELEFTYSGMREMIGGILHVLIENSVKVRWFSENEADLENVFMKIMNSSGE